MKVIDLIRFYLQDCNSVLDLGCGTGWVLNELNKRKMVGIDLYVDHLVQAVDDNPMATFIRGDINNITTYFVRKSFDAIILIDSLEHLTKQEGLQLLKACEVISKKKIIVFTPLGEVHNNTKINKWNKHNSGWVVQDLQKLGYSTAQFNNYHLGTERLEDLDAILAWKELNPNY